MDKFARTSAIAVTFLFILGSMLTLIEAGSDPEENDDPISQNVLTAHMNDVFIENNGQYKENVRFLSRSGAYAITDDSILFFDTSKGMELIFGYHFKDFSNWDPQGVEGLGSYLNYFYGSDPSKWINKAQHFSAVELSGVYSGIDLKVYFSEGSLKYDLLVGQGVSEANIRIEVLYADSVEVNEDSISIQTNDITTTDSDLLVYHTDNSIVSSSFKEKGPNSFGFELFNRDTSKSVVIDPLIYSTVIGGAGDDLACDGKVTKDGGFVFTGNTFGNHPMRGSPYDNTHNGNSDAYVCKLNSDGSDIVWATYIGGSGWERGYGLILDDSEDMYIAGTTSSTGFPTTNGAYDEDYSGGDYDQFVLKLSSDGSSLVYSTLCGGNDDDQCKGIVMDDEGDIIVIGSSNSNNYPVTNGAYDTSQNGGSDLVVTKFNSALSLRRFSTFFGGYSDDFGRYIQLGPEGEIYLMGKTSSTDLYTSNNAFDKSYGGGFDYFILQLNTIGSSVIYSTYLGGSAEEHYQKWGGQSLRIDDEGFLYIAGTTLSSNFPTTPGALSTIYGGDDGTQTQGDAFVTKMHPTLDRLSYSTYLGSQKGDTGFGLNVDAQGRAILVGAAGFGGYPTGFPITSNAFQSSPNSFGTYGDAYLAVLSQDGREVEYGTFYGGVYFDGFYSVELDDQENLYLHGKTNSIDFHTTPGCFDSEIENFDSVVVKWKAIRDPYPPENLTIYKSDIDVVLKWDPPSGMPIQDILNYSVYRGPVPEMMTEIGRFKDATFFFDDSVSPGMKYYYHVTTHNWFGESAPSEVVSITPGIVPGVVLNFTGTSSNNTAALGWNHSDNRGLPFMDEYTIYRGIDISNMTKVVDLNYNIHEYIDNGLENGVTYFYYIISRNSVGSSPISNYVAVTPSSIPSQPMYLEAVPGDSIIDLNWNHPYEDGGIPIANYTIWRGPSTNNLTFFAKIQFPYSSYVDEDVTNGNTYYYKVTAWNTNGESVASEIAVGVPKGPPSPPINLTAISRDGSITLIWEPPIDLGGDLTCEYRLYRKEMTGYFQQVDETEGTYLVDENVENGVRYTYMVLSFNSIGSSDPSNEAYSTPFGKPSPPIGIDAIAGDAEVHLTWGKPLDLGGSVLTGYNIFRKDHEENFTKINANSSLSQFYTDISVENGIEYTYYITAYTEIFESRGSVEISIIPRGKPSQPVDLRSNSGNGFIQLTWLAPKDDGGANILGYRLFRSGPSEIEKEMGPLDPMILTYNDSSVVNGGSYLYHLIAFNSVGDSLSSPFVGGDPGSRPNSPSALEVAIVDKTPHLTWARPTDDGGMGISEYIVYRRSEGTTPTIIARVNGNTNFIVDEEIEKDKDYFYSVSAVNQYGEGPLSPETLINIETVDETDTAKIILMISTISLLIILIIVIVVFFFLLSRSKKEQSESDRGMQSPEDLPPEENNPFTQRPPSPLRGQGANVVSGTFGTEHDVQIPSDGVQTPPPIPMSEQNPLLVPNISPPQQTVGPDINVEQIQQLQQPMGTMTSDPQKLSMDPQN